MPSNKVLEENKALVVTLTDKLKNATAGVLIDYKGINVADDTALRKEFREAGVSYTVVKNTMLRFASKNAGLDELNNVLAGTTALAISDNDPIIAAKIAVKYSEKIKKGFEIKSGFMDGVVLDSSKVAELGNLPSRDGLLGQLLSVLTADLRGMAVALSAIAEQKESASVEA